MPAKTETWGREHWLIAREYLEEFDILEHFDSPKTKKFSMLALGALLGLHSAEMIDDRVYQIGCKTLPGYILGKGAAVQALGKTSRSQSITAQRASRVAGC